MMSIRLDPETESKLAEICARKGVSKSACVRMALERFIAAEQSADPHAVLMEVRARYRLTGGERTDKAERHSELLKEKLRAKHRR